MAAQVANLCVVTANVQTANAIKMDVALVAIKNALAMQQGVSAHKRRLQSRGAWLYAEPFFCCVSASTT